MFFGAALGQRENLDQRPIVLAGEREAVFILILILVAMRHTG